eukprot:COSAG01_NODE_18759_length_1055_cov_1.404812_1_plen_155_part_10
MQPTMWSPCGRLVSRLWTVLLVLMAVPRVRSTRDRWYFVGPGRDTDRAPPNQAIPVTLSPNSASINFEVGTRVEKYQGNTSTYEKYLSGDFSQRGVDMCWTEAFDNAHDTQWSRSCRELRPVLTMPKETNTLKVIVTDQTSTRNRVDYAVDVTVQ